MAFGSWRSRKEHSRLGRIKFLSHLSDGMLFLVIVFLVLLFGGIIFYATQVPSPNDLTNRASASSTKIYDRDGELLYDIYQDQNRTYIKLDEIPQHVKQATIAIEYKDFYKHGGFSIPGIVRSVLIL